MSTGKTNLTSTQFASKKLLGKAHTSNLKGDVNESIPSNVSLPSEGIFGESIPNNPGTSFYTLYSASAGAGATAERVYLDVIAISDTIYDANVSGGGGDEASNSGTHGYYLLHTKQLHQIRIEAPATLLIAKGFMILVVACS